MSNKVPSKTKVPGGAFYAGDGLTVDPITRTVSASGGGDSGVTTLHIYISAVDQETLTPTFTADKTPEEMQQAAVNGPVWCVVTVAAGIMAEEAVSVGVPPAWYAVGVVAFGGATANAHNDNGNNKTGYAVRAGSEGWFVDLTQFGS